MFSPYLHAYVILSVLNPYFQTEKVEAGCDEAGRGCLAGPVVAAAVILPKEYHHEVLNDSKQLTEKQRSELKEEIKKDAIGLGHWRSIPSGN